MEQIRNTLLIMIIFKTVYKKLLSVAAGKTIVHKLVTALLMLSRTPLCNLKQNFSKDFYTSLSD